jgi:uncharacterized protein (TIGR02145 family)
MSRPVCFGNRRFYTLFLAAALLVGAGWLAGCGNKDKPLIDERDGQKYKIVTIGNKTWMAQNLNYQPQTGKSWCYDNMESNCNKYGRLYDWSTAMDIDTSYNGSAWKGSDVKHKGVCPVGWHLPSNNEWDELVNTVDYPDGTKLKSKNSWHDKDVNNSGNGTDEYGFSALPGGGRDFDGRFGSVGGIGEWWTVTEYNSDRACCRYMVYMSDIVDGDSCGKSYGHSVRCVKD